jgi:ABC-2 type transport system permease protein
VKRAIAIARRIVWQMLRDRRTLAMILVAPLMVMGLLALIFNGKDYQPRIAVVGVPPALVQALADNGARPTPMTPDDATAALARRDVDATLSLDGPPHLVVEGSDPSITRATMMVLAKLNQGNEPQVEYLHGKPNMSAFDNFGPVLLGFLVFFFTFIVSGVSFVRERTTGTLDRMLATPVRRWEVVVGYLIGFAGVVIAQTTLVALFAVYVLDMMSVGSFAWLLLLVLLTAMSALTLGMFLSAYSKSEFQVVQFIPLVVVPQVFFSGLFPMDSMHPALRALGAVLPLTYAADGLRAVMIRGGGLADLALPLAVLTGFSTLFVIANVIALRKVRRM